MPCQSVPSHAFRLSWLTLALLAALPGRAGAQDAPATAAQPADTAGTASEAIGRVLVTGRRRIQVGPVPGLELSRDQVPAHLQSAGKDDLRQSRALNIGDFMNSQMQGVSINDYAGNPFQLDVNFRGFTASPQVGTPQGLSVFFDGVRVNEPFGDVVNWDLIPMNALERFDLFPGSNPLFGLNTLGGALALRSKSGFSAPGVEADLSRGSFGRREVRVSVGQHDEDLGAFVALTHFEEDGWRDHSPSRVTQAFGRLDWHGERGSVTTSLMAADNTLIGNGLLPLTLYETRPNSVFSAPDQAHNTVVQLGLSGQYDIDDWRNLTAQTYWRRSRRGGLNGDIYEGFDDFDIEHDAITDPTDPRIPIPRNGANDAFGDGPGVIQGTPNGLLTRTGLSQTVTGLALQFNSNTRPHAFMVGASLDRARTSYSMSQRLGLLSPTREVLGAPQAIDGQYYAASHDIVGNDFAGRSTTVSLFASDSWTVWPGLSLSAAARFNRSWVDNRLAVRASSANVALHELRTGSAPLQGYLQGQTITEEAFRYTSLNPSLGVNWQALPRVHVFGNLSQGARAPSVVELGCAFDATPVLRNPDNPALGKTARSLVGPGCNLPTTLSGDPYLPQIRSLSGELGARGTLGSGWEWNLSAFRTDLKDDLYFVGVGDGRSYFDTIGRTRRQGAEMGLKGRIGAWQLGANYSYTVATFESEFYTLSQRNSSADFDQNSRSGDDRYLEGQTGLPTPGATLNRGYGTYRMIHVMPGAEMPGIPRHGLNLQLRWQATAALQLGLVLQARSGVFVRGNENNRHQGSGSDQETGQYYCSLTSCPAEGYQQAPVNPGRAFTEPGRLPGYALLNLDASWQWREGVSLFLQVRNLLDRRYASAGRLGINPFTAGANGVQGPSGWNYNSADWRPSTLVAPGAPRQIQLGITINWGGPA
jgi:iron complex outermembrane recepter protein